MVPTLSLTRDECLFVFVGSTCTWFLGISVKATIMYCATHRTLGLLNLKLFIDFFSLCDTPLGGEPVFFSTKQISVKMDTYLGRALKIIAVTTTYETYISHISLCNPLWKQEKEFYYLYQFE